MALIITVIIIVTMKSMWNLFNILHVALQGTSFHVTDMNTFISCYFAHKIILKF